MRFPVILAHGALGPYDEVIMLGAAAILLVMMGVSWVRSRNMRPEFEAVEAAQEEAKRDSVEKAEKAEEADESERFRLD